MIIADIIDFIIRNTFFIRFILYLIGNHPEYTQIFINLFLSFATFFAVIVAIFQEKIKMFIMGPKLSISNTEVDFKFMVPEKIDVPLGEQKSIIFIYRFLEIINKGLSVAEGTKCTVRRVFSTSSDGKNIDKTFFTPIQLPWILGKFDLIYTQTINEVDIFPGESRFLNFLCIRTEEKLTKFTYCLMDKGVSTDYDFDSESFYLMPSDEEVILEITLYSKNSLGFKQLLKISRFTEKMDIWSSKGIEIKKIEKY